MTEEKTICKKSLKEIRKAYFQKKLPKLLQDIQSEGKVEENELIELNNYLEELKKENKNFLEKTLEIFGGRILNDEPKPPTTEELYSRLSEEDFKSWQENVSNAYLTINQIRAKVASLANKHQPIKNNDLYDYAIVIETLKRWIAQDCIYKEQLAQKRLTDIIDDFEVSRKEAEDRTKITKEYSDYKNAEKEYDSICETVLLYKKRAGQE